VEQQNMPPEPLSGAAPQAEAEIPARGSVGALLKASRSRLGIDLAVIADTLRIRLVYLEAIEAGAMRTCPRNLCGGVHPFYGDQVGWGRRNWCPFQLETGPPRRSRRRAADFVSQAGQDPGAAGRRHRLRGGGGGGPAGRGLAFVFQR
jgi:hypothetical protein